MQKDMDQKDERNISFSEQKFIGMEYKKSCPYMQKPMMSCCPMMQ